MSHWTDNYNVGGNMCNNKDLDDDPVVYVGRVYSGSFMWCHRVYESGKEEWSEPMLYMDDEDF